MKSTKPVLLKNIISNGMFNDWALSRCAQFLKKIDFKDYKNSFQSEFESNYEWQFAIEEIERDIKVSKLYELSLENKLSKLLDDVKIRKVRKWYNKCEFK